MAKNRSFDLVFQSGAVAYAIKHSGEESVQHLGEDPKRNREWRSNG